MLLEQEADTAHAPELVFEAVDIVVPDGLLIPYLAVVDAGIDMSAVAVHAHDVLAVMEIAPPSSPGSPILACDGVASALLPRRRRTKLNATRTATNRVRRCVR